MSSDFNAGTASAKNPILGGSVSLLLTGFVLWGLKQAPLWLARLVRRFLFNELVFDNAMEHGQWRVPDDQPQGQAGNSRYTV